MGLAAAAAQVAPTPDALPISTLEPVIMGLHRANQLGLPLTVAGAGLPSLPAVAGEARSYAERLFTFPTIGSLDYDEVVEAVSVPAAAEGVDWSADAITLLFDVSHGYPYVIHELGRQAWDAPDETSRLITRGNVERSVGAAIDELDSGFFPVRTGRTTDQERA